MAITFFLGGDTFNDYSAHPDTLHNAGAYRTTAAGRYQFVYATWEDLATKLGLSDFSPANQDLGAIELIRERGALDDVINGNFDVAVQKVSNIWASLPGSTAGQHTQKLSDLQTFYSQSGGNIA
jgi:lysozyme